MSDNSNKAWITKFGPRRVRNEAPTLAEAIAAAQGLADELEEQADIAASLMGVPRDQVRAELVKLMPARGANVQQVTFSGRAGVQRTVVVERKPARRMAQVDRAAVIRKFSAGR